MIFDNIVSIEEFNIINSINIPYLINIYESGVLSNNIQSYYNHIEAKNGDILRIIHFNNTFSKYSVYYNNFYIPLYILRDTIKINSNIFQLNNNYTDNIEFNNISNDYFNHNRLVVHIYENKINIFNLFSWNNQSIENIYKLEKRLKLKTILFDDL